MKKKKEYSAPEISINKFVIFDELLRESSEDSMNNVFDEDQDVDY